MIGRSLYTVTLRLSSLNWKDSIKTVLLIMAKKFRFNKDTPKVVISQEKKVPEPQPPTGAQPPQQAPKMTEQEPLYCIEENVTTGWEILETDLTKANCESKYKWYAEQFTIPPQSIRIRRVR